MINSSCLLQETNEKDLVFFRIGTILGIVSLPSLKFFYEYLFNKQYPFMFITLALVFIFILFLITTLIKKFNKYSYLFSVISLYATTLFFIHFMIIIDFQLNIILTLAITISILSSGFKDEKMMTNYLISMISICIAIIFIYNGFSIITMMSIVPLVVWPTLIYFMLKSKFEDKNKLEKSTKFLQVLFKSIKDPTILVVRENFKIVDCSDSIISTFNFGSRDNIIGKSISEINSLYMNNAIDNNTILKLYSPISEKIEFNIDINNENKYFNISSNGFVADSKLYILFMISDITFEKKQSNKIYSMAFTDELTRIDNRRSGIVELKKAIIDYEKNNLMFAVFFIDIDRFKYINDSYGHDSGDILLHKVASRLMSSTGEDDIVSRIGGDEFMVIAKYLKNENVVDLIAHRIINKINMPIKIENNKVSITISMGISVYPNYGNDYKDLMKNSDIALYKSKKMGGNQYCVFTD